jgi:hypothetical protein
MNSTEKFRKTKKGILTNSYSKQKTRKNVTYTLKELHLKFLNDNRFNRLFNEWVKSNYNKEFKPTIDRINCKLDYNLDNIQCLTWSENRYKQRMETNIFRAKEIICLKDNIVVNTFRSVSDAVMKTGIMQSNISSCLTGKRKTCGGYNWQYKNIYENQNLLKCNE